MANLVSLANLRTRMLQRIDRLQNQSVPSPFFTTSELNGFINNSLFELYDLLISAYGEDYFMSSQNIVTDGVNQLYNLPSDFYKLRGIDLAVNNTPNGSITLKPFNFGDRNRFSVPNFQTFYGITNLRYRINGSKLQFIPLPMANQNLTVWYIPSLTQLVNDGDTFDFISGWDEYVIVDGAIKCLGKEERDSSLFQGQKLGLLKRIESMAANRDAGFPKTVQDTSYIGMGFPGDPGMGYGPGW